MAGSDENLDGIKQPRHHPQAGESVTQFIDQVVSSLGVLHIPAEKGSGGLRAQKLSATAPSIGLITSTESLVNSFRSHGN
jgi:hypothetical protein